MKQLIKSELIAELQADSNKGIAFNQSGIPLQVMTFREFLTWYDDTGHDRYSVEAVNEYDEESPYQLVRRLASGKFVDSEEFETEEEANDEYYEVMERRYNEDNGTGGIYYDNSEALARLNDAQDEWQQLFDIEDIDG
jgi:coproporphyrinogen III oxidase